MIIQTLSKKLVQFYQLLGFNRLSIKNLSTTGTNFNKPKFLDSTTLVQEHFDVISSNHPSRHTIQQALEKLKNQPALIIETGSSAWGVNSSVLFDNYVNSFGGEFQTVDLRLHPMLKLKGKLSPKSTLNCDNSVNFLKRWSLKNPNKKIDLLYLDSWDVVWNNPDPSGLHGLAEYLVAAKHLKKGSLLLIDDTPSSEKFFLSNISDKNAFSEYYRDNNFYPGKGSLVKQHLISLKLGHEVAHDYQLLWEF